MACDQPARAHHPALGAAAVERACARRRRRGRVGKVSFSVEAPHLVVERTRRGVAAALRCILLPPHGVRRRCGRPSRRPSARARSTSTSRRTPRAAYDSATARRSSRARRNKLWARRAALKRTSRPQARGAASRRPPRVEIPAARRPRALQMKPVRDRPRQTHAIDATSC